MSVRPEVYGQMMRNMTQVKKASSTRPSVLKARRGRVLASITVVFVPKNDLLANPVHGVPDISRRRIAGAQGTDIQNVQP